MQSHDHGHGHGHGHGHDHGQDHDHDDSWERGDESSLFQHIDTPKVRALNCATEPVTGCFKPWERRLTEELFIESDADDELILYVPFTGTVTLKSIRLIGGRDGRYPATMKVFVNREDVDFDNVRHLTPAQEWHLVEDFRGDVDYQTKIAKFQGVASLTFFFSGTLGGADALRVSYIGLRGQYAPAIRNAVITVYESQANPADHKVHNDTMISRSIQ